MVYFIRVSQGSFTLGVVVVVSLVLILWYGLRGGNGIS